MLGVGPLSGRSIPRADRGGRECAEGSDAEGRHDVGAGEQLQVRRDWRRKEEQVLDEAVALRKDIPKHELAAHPRAAGVGPDAVREREEKIRKRIAHDEEGYAAERMRRSRGLSM